MAPPRHDHVNVVTADMDRAIAFYTGLLGLAVVMDRRLDGPWFQTLIGQPAASARCVILDAPGGGCRIELLHFPAGMAQPQQPPTIAGLRHVAIRVDDLDVRLDLLRRDFAQEVAVIEVPHDIVKGGKRMCYLRDPDGTIVELCEYGLDRPEFHGCPTSRSALSKATSPA